MVDEKPIGYMVCISMLTLEKAEATAKDIENWCPYITHLRPIFNGPNDSEVAGLCIQEEEDA